MADLRPAPRVRNPLLTARDAIDVPHARFTAHPYVVRVANDWHMFFEVYSKETNKGVIALATSDDGLDWTYRRVVLQERFHLTNPYVFPWDGDYWMIPDTHTRADIRLYRASRFPSEWTYVATLVEGAFADPSVIRHRGRWWMFACGAPGEADTLRLFHADELSGPWHEHPKSPIREGDARHARPAGRLLELDGYVVRFAQDWCPVWAMQVWAFQVTELGRRAYRERPLLGRPVLRPGAGAWNRLGISHLDAGQSRPGRWLAFVHARGEFWTLQAKRRPVAPRRGAVP